MNEVDCKYILPCGRCDKHGMWCEMFVERIRCDHEWLTEESCNFVNLLGEQRRHEKLVCTKCGERKTREIDA